MKITIHRGAYQIGGCVTEIATSESKILIDFGCNLPGSETPDFTKTEVARICKGVDALFYTHYHGDHIGYVEEIPDEVEQYIGEAAKEVMLCKFETLNAHQDWKSSIRAIERMKCYHPKRSVTIHGDDIKITPYFVSHSAADAYMFKIEVEGLTILHTGDFRRHGYLGKGLIPALEKYIGQVDLLIIEGTMLSRKAEVVDHEVKIQQGAIKLLKRATGKHLFALCSSTDMDRLASFHVACQKTGAVFVCDSYQKRVLDVFTRHCGTKTELYDFSDTWVLGNDCDFENLKIKGFIMPVRSSMKGFIQRMRYYFPDAELIYSMWKGYYEGTEKQINPDIVQIVEAFHKKTHYLHTSGHADVETLQEVCRVTQPRLGIIPIHKEKTSLYEELPIANEYRIISSSINVGNITVEIK